MLGCLPWKHISSYILEMASATSLEELTQDVTELKRLLDSASRSRVRSLLASCIQKLEMEISQHKEKNEKENLAEARDDSKATIIKKSPPGYSVKLSTYAWEDSGKVVKIYVTLDGVQTLPEENVTVDFTATSFLMKALGLNGKNYELHVKNLLFLIRPDESSFKVKRDMVMITLRKKDGTQKWAYVVKTEQKEKDKKPIAPDLDTSGDPSANLMNLMKKMYDEGDDEMKRTIKKAMVESQEKRASGELGMP